MKFYLDTEFIEAGPHKPIQLISVGLVSEAGDTFYAISSEFIAADASPWVQENVLAKLEPECEVPRKTLARIAEDVRGFIGACTQVLGENEKPQFYGYYSAYDHVVFCQMFGTMMDLPKGWPMFTRDLIQTAKEVQARWGVDVIAAVEQPKGEHNALVDAQWNRTLAQQLEPYQRATIQGIGVGVVRSWPVGTVLPATVESCSAKTLIVIDGRREGHVLLGTGHDPKLQKGTPGKITFMDGGPRGGFWQFAADAPAP